MIENYSTVVLIAEAGSGKTTRKDPHLPNHLTIF